MSDPESLSDVMRLVRSADTLDPPAVDTVRSVIRSGDQFLIGGQTETLPGKDPAAPPAASSAFIGGVVMEWGYEVDPAKGAQFHRWLTDNEDELRRVTPAGAHYWGTYAVFADSDQTSGGYRTIWGYESFAALGTVNAALAADQTSRFAVLMKELNAFRDRRIGAGRSQQIYQPAAFTTRI